MIRVDACPPCHTKVSYLSDPPCHTKVGLFVWCLKAYHIVIIQPNIPQLSELTHLDVDFLVMVFIIIIIIIIIIIRFALHARSQSFFQF